MQRLALTKSDKEVRDWFVDEATCIGCKIKIDAIGNIFAILPGSNPALSPIGLGSHLDTQPSGEMLIDTKETLLPLMFIRRKIRWHTWRHWCPGDS